MAQTLTITRRTPSAAQVTMSRAAVFNAFDYLTKIGDKVALISWSVVCLLIGIFTMAVCVYVWMGLGGAA